MKKTCIIFLLSIIWFCIPACARTVYDKSTNSYFVYNNSNNLYKGRYQKRGNKAYMWDSTNRYCGYNEYLNDKMYVYNDQGIIMLVVPVTVLDKKKSVMKYTNDYLKKKAVASHSPAKAKAVTVAKPMNKEDAVIQKEEEVVEQQRSDIVEDAESPSQVNNDVSATSPKYQQNNSTIDTINNGVNTVNSIMNMVRGFSGY